MQNLITVGETVRAYVWRPTGNLGLSRSPFNVPVIMGLPRTARQAVFNTAVDGITLCLHCSFVSPNAIIKCEG